MKWISLHVVVLALGVFAAFHPTLQSGFGRLQADPGDTLLNAYILEHSWLWLTKTDCVGTYWSPAFFHPQPLVLAYSENLLGTAPLYWSLRLACPPILAFQLWMMLVIALTYVSFALVLRKFGVGDVLAALGGFVFAFGLPRIAQVGHQQLLPHLFAPWAVLAAWRFVERPTVTSLALMLAAGYAQLLASVYLGSFLLLGLAIFGVASLVNDGDFRRALAGFLRQRWPSVTTLTAIWLGGLVLLTLPYREANRDFRRPYAEVLSLTPRPSSWLSPAPQGVWNDWLPRDDQPELRIFPGAMVLLIAVCGLASRRSRKFTVVALAIALLAMRFGDWSAWRAMYRWAPGGEAIRAVARVVFTAELFGIIGGLLALDGWLRQIRLGGVIAALICVVGIAEQLPVREWPSFEVAPWQARVAELKQRHTPGTVAYVDLPENLPYWESQLTAMWAGMEANVPVVNGYSGRYPKGYPDWSRSMTSAELNSWTGGAPVVRIAVDEWDR